MAEEEKGRLLLEEQYNIQNTNTGNRNTFVNRLGMGNLLLGSILAGSMMPQPAGKNAISNAADLFLKTLTATNPKTLMPPGETTLKQERAKASVKREDKIYESARNAQNVLLDTQKLDTIVNTINSEGFQTGGNLQLVNSLIGIGRKYGLQFEGDTKNINDLINYGNIVTKELAMGGLQAFPGAISDRELIYSESSQLGLGLEDVTYKLKSTIDKNKSQFLIDSADAQSIFQSGGANINDRVTVQKSNITGKAESLTNDEFRKDYLLGLGYEFVNKDGLTVPKEEITLQNINKLQISLLKDIDRQALDLRLRLKSDKNYTNSDSWITKEINGETFYIYKGALNKKNELDDKYFQYLDVDKTEENPNYSPYITGQVIIEEDKYKRLTGK